MSDFLDAALHSTHSGSNGVLTLKQAASDGAADAREAATRFATSASLFASRFIYTTAYSISYGVVFPTTLLARSIPKNNAVVRGLIEGARAASGKADEIVRR